MPVPTPGKPEELTLSPAQPQQGHFCSETLPLKIRISHRDPQVGNQVRETSQSWVGTDPPLLTLGRQGARYLSQPPSPTQNLPRQPGGPGAEGLAPYCRVHGATADSPQPCEACPSGSAPPSAEVWPSMARLQCWVAPGGGPCSHPCRADLPPPMAHSRTQCVLGRG